MIKRLEKGNLLLPIVNLFWLSDYFVGLVGGLLELLVVEKRNHWLFGLVDCCLIWLRRFIVFFGVGFGKGIEFILFEVFEVCID